MQLTPSGNVLFVSIPGQTSGTILSFSVNSGVLALTNGTPTDGPNPDGLAVDPGGTYLYASNFSSNSISIFKIGTATSPTALSEVSGSPLSTGYTAPVTLTLDPKGQYLYVANQGSNNVAAYSINSTTALPNILTTSTTSGAFATEGSPSFLAFDPSGKYLYVGNQGSSAGIQTFSVSAGNLTVLPTYVVGNTPSSIVVLGK
jgi:6-phosphogluconolactonase (cycloisomerase 2 family)